MAKFVLKRTFCVSAEICKLYQWSFHVFLHTKLHFVSENKLEVQFDAENMFCRCFGCKGAERSWFYVLLPPKAIKKAFVIPLLWALKSIVMKLLWKIQKWCRASFRRCCRTRSCYRYWIQGLRHLQTAATTSSTSRCNIDCWIAFRISFETQRRHEKLRFKFRFLHCK